MLELLVRRPHFFVPRELNALRPVSQLSTYIYIYMYVCMYFVLFSTLRLAWMEGCRLSHTKATCGHFKTCFTASTRTKSGCVPYTVMCYVTCRCSFCWLGSG